MSHFGSKGHGRAHRERTKRYSLEQIEAAFKEADVRMKESNGHRFFIMLKRRCEYCGRSPNQKGRCNYWYQTLYTFAIENLTNLSEKK